MKHLGALGRFYAGHFVDRGAEKGRFVQNARGIGGFFFSSALGIVVSIQLTIHPDADKRGVVMPLFFDIFGGIIPMVLASTAVVIAGHIFAERLCKMVFARLNINIASQAVKAISMASTVLASIIAGFVALIAFKNILAVMIMASAGSTKKNHCLSMFYDRYASNPGSDLNDLVGVRLLLLENFGLLGMDREEEWDREHKFKLAMFEILAGIVPAVLGVAGVLVAGYFFAEQLCRTVLEGLIAQEAIKAIAIGGTVAAAAITGVIMPVLCKNIFAAIVTTLDPVEVVEYRPVVGYI